MPRPSQVSQAHHQDDSCAACLVETRSDSTEEPEQHPEQHHELVTELRWLAKLEGDADERSQVKWFRDGCPCDDASSEVAELCMDLNRRYALGQNLTEFSLPSCCDLAEVPLSSAVSEGRAPESFGSYGGLSKDFDVRQIFEETGSLDEACSDASDCDTSTGRCHATYISRSPTTCSLGNSNTMDSLPEPPAYEDEEEDAPVLYVSAKCSLLTDAADPGHGVEERPGHEQGEGHSACPSSASLQDESGNDDADASSLQAWLERKRSRRERLAAKTRISYGAFLHGTHEFCA